MSSTSDGPLDSPAVDTSYGALTIIPHDVNGFTNSSEWTEILTDSHQVVLYNSDSHALAVRRHRHEIQARSVHEDRDCPFCGRPMDDSPKLHAFRETQDRTRVPNYFQLLEVSNEMSSRAGTPAPSSGSNGMTNAHFERAEEERQFETRSMAEGYFEAFFKEEFRLGMGANGSVFLCQHVLDGNPLGHFAVKKIAVGQSHSYLVQILGEIRLLEQLRHPNIITYHHAWLELHQFSSFGPRVPTLFILMQWAEGGSLDDFIMARMGRRQGTERQNSNVNPHEDMRSRSDRIRAFRAERARPEEERKRRLADRRRGQRTAVHLLSAEEIHSLFLDIISGLSFLHDKSILHLDLKPGNVLLTWDDNAMTPRAMLSDFGTSRDMINPKTTRSGNTGTLEYAAPESLRSQTGQLFEIDSKADMWSLGMILHMLLFFRLPFHYSSDGDMRSGGGDMLKLEKEVAEYQGFRRTHTMNSAFEKRGLPGSYLLLLESLLHRNPKARPSSEQVLRAILNGNFDPLPAHEEVGNGTLIPHSTPGYFDDLRSSLEGPASVSGDANSPFTPTNELELETPYPLNESEKAPARHVLALPPSPESLSPVEGMPSPIWSNGLEMLGLNRVSVIRSVKSAILVGKVMSLFLLCPSGRPDPLVTGTLATLAVSDMWTTSLIRSGALAIAHLLGLRLFGESQFSSLRF